MTAAGPRRWALAAALAAIAGVLLYPYRLAPDNAVTWLESASGLAFGGEGIAHSEAEIPGAAPHRSISLELWLKQRPDARNWGAREIFSLYDGRPSPALLVGAYGNRLFLFGRSEPPHAEEWFRQFLPGLRLERGRRHFVAATWDPEARALYRDGELVARRTNLGPAPAFSGRPVLGNGPDGRRGWWGEVHGLALFGAAHPPETIRRHGARVERDGLGALADEPELLALYTFDEGGGRWAKDALDPGAALRIPERFAALPRSMLRRPGDDVPGRSPVWYDPLQNVLLFLPLGFLLRGSTARRIALGFALSLVLESLQLWIPTRAASTLDVAWNTLGAAAGAALARRTGRRRQASGPSAEPRAVV